MTDQHHRYQEGIARLDSLMVREYGSLLHNVRPGGPGLCSVCSTPVANNYTRCLACNQAGPRPGLIGRSRRFADRVAFMTYAVEGDSQAYSVLRGYKMPAVQDRYWTTAAAWIVWFVSRHGVCAHQLAGHSDEAWMWATVPSARSGRSGEHPLHAIVSRVWADEHAEAQLSLSEGARGQSRQYDEAKFIAEPIPSGSHVILVDDSWTTGANVQSAASALKIAGADQVSAMVVGRLLRDDWPPTREFLATGGLTSPFDPSECPWGGGSRHP